jgi:hypothetical protein
MTTYAGTPGNGPHPHTCRGCSHCIRVSTKPRDLELPYCELVKKEDREVIWSGMASCEHFALRDPRKLLG